MPMASLMIQFSLHLLKPRRMKLQKEYHIIRSIHQLVANNYSLKEALDILLWDKTIQSSIQQMSYSLENGEDFSHTCYLLGFSPMTISLFSTSTKNGDLFHSISLCRNLLESRISFTKKFRSVSKYPIFLLSFFLLLLIVLKSVILPHYQNLIHIEHPFLLLSFRLIDSFIYLILGSFILSLFILHLVKTNVLRIPPHKQIHIIRYIPIYRYYKTMETTLMFCSHLVSFMHTNLSLKECMEFLQTDKQNTLYSYYAAKIEEHLANGFTYSDVLPNCQLLSDQLQWILEDNKHRAQVMKDLEMYASNLLDEMKLFLENFLKWLQPIILSIIALFVALIYLSLILPLYDYIQYL